MFFSTYKSTNTKNPQTHFDQFAPFSGGGGEGGSKSIALFGFSKYLQERLKFVIGLF